MALPLPGRLPTGALVALTLTLTLASATTLRAGPGDAAAPAESAAAEPAVVVSPQTVPATGSQHVDIEIPRFGRYAILAVGGSGSALTLVDRLSGPIATDGEPGFRQGRLNAVLEPGRYRVRLQSPLDGLGAVSVEVRPYSEQNEPVVELTDNTVVQSTLSDLEERSWWVQTDGATPLMLDAAGRSLTELRLWRDGAWSVSARPTCDTLTDIDGHQLGRCTLIARLEAGLYRVTATGGPARPRADGVADEPLWVRRGTSTLAEGSRPSRTLSAFGFDRYLVNTGGRARLTLGAAGAVNLDARQLRPEGLGGYGGRASIASDARVMATEMTVPRGTQVLTVQGAPGQPYQLQLYQPASNSTRIGGTRSVWASSLPAGEPGDELDQTALLMSRPKAREPLQVAGASAVIVSSTRSYRRRFNLRGPSSLWVDFQSEGRWVIEANGVNISVNPPVSGSGAPTQKAAATERGQVVADLPAGLQRIDLSPVEPGLAELVIRPEGAPVPADWTPPKVAVRFPELKPASVQELFVLMGSVNGVGQALVSRELPATMSEPLPLVLAPGEVVELPVQSDKVTDLVADVEGVLLSLDQGDAKPRVRIGPVTQRLRVHNRSERVVFVSIAPPADASQTPARLLKPDAERLPLLTADTPVFSDIGQNAASQWRVSVPESGAWRVESTGLLHLQGSLEDRAGLVRASGAANGSGRNVRLDAELPRGETVLSLRARGETEGHYGLKLTRLAELDGGALRPDSPARAEVPAGATLRFQVEITEKGRYALSAEIPGQEPRLRLSDADGWPLFPAGAPLDDLSLDPGRYALTVLPMSADVRARAELQRLDPPALPEGHGPFALQPGSAATHVWREPAAGQERSPDLWTFTLPARVEARLRLSADMVGRLIPASGAPIEPVRDGWEGTLEAGDWRLELRSNTIDSLISYSVNLSSRTLFAGSELSSSVPGALSVAVGEPGLYTLSSVARSDLRARLLDAEGRLVFEADDRPGAWDFARTAWLEPGLYRLELRPVGSGARSSSRVRMQRQVPVEHGPVRPGSLPVAASGQGDAWTVDLAAGELLVARAASAENLGLALDEAVGAAWRTQSTDEGTRPWVAARGPARLRVRLWSLDQRGLPATLTVASGKPAAGERALQLPDDGSRVAMAEGSGELLSLSGRLDPRVCAAPGGACRAVPGSLLAPGDSSLWAVALNEEAAPAELRLRPAALTDATALTLLPGARWQRGSEGGLSLIRVAAAAEAPRPTCPESACFADVSLERAGGSATLLLDAGQPVQLRAEDAEPLAARAERRRFDKVDSADITLPWSGTIPAGGARRLRLKQSGPLALTLAPELVLRAERDGRAEVLDATRDGLFVTLADGARELVIVNPASTARALTVRAAPVQDPAAELLQLDAPSAGLLVLSREGAGTLHTGGAASSLVASGPTGAFSGDEVALPDGDWSVRLRHEAGPLVLWRERPGELASALLSGGARATTLASRSGEVPLSGEIVSVRLPAGAPGPLTIRAPGAAAVILSGPDGHAELRYPDATGRLDILVSKEGQTLSFRSLGGVPLWGRASLEEIPAGTLPTEGAGEAVLLAPGERRAYPIQLEAPTELALGVRATPERARMLVLGPDGARLAEGLVAQLTLPAGQSWLVIQASGEGGPVSASPVIAGRAPPKAGAPDEVVRDYAIRDGRIPAPPPEADEDPEDYSARGWGVEGDEGDEGDEYYEGDTGGSDTGGEN